MTRAVALRLDDVGAASKLHEVYGITRIPLGPLALPFPGNLLFLKYLPPIKRWAPYPELTAAQWEQILAVLAGAGAKLTVAVTAGWVERDGRIVPFPVKFPAAARMLRQGLGRGLLEIANHGYTHCVVEDGLFRPRLFSGNRRWHREFYDWLPEDVHREHLTRAQGILQEYFGCPVVTLVPPGNVFARHTLAAAAVVGIRYVSCGHAGRLGPVGGITFVHERLVLSIHDRDLVRGGLASFRDLLEDRRDAPFVTVREVGEQLDTGCQ